MLLSLIYPDRKDCPFKRVDGSDDNCGLITLKGNIMGEKVTIKGYDHIWEHYEEKDGEKDAEKIELYNYHIEDYTSTVEIEIDKGYGRSIDFHFEAYTGIKEFKFTGAYIEPYQGSGANEIDIPGNEELGILFHEIEEDPEKWLAAKGIECGISLANMVEEYMKNDRRHYLINWMKSLKDFTTT